jgi:predicted CXXCH cytochrome family protein
MTEKLFSTSVAAVVPLFLFAAAGWAQAPAGGAAAAKVDQCVACHTDLEGRLGEPVKALQKDDVHGQHGLSCASCHGGDPSQESRKAAMNPAKGFVASPKHQDIPRFCGKCHSDAAFMKQFNPAERTDQESEYSTSVHGKRLKQGDQKVAVCTSCHGFHGVKAVKNSTAPVYPLHVAETCGSCHANAGYMQSYGIPTDQLAKWRTSVHGEAMLKKQDLSAPTCNDCHGNHGAAPPSVASVANVCGTCHVRQSELFQKSPHAKPFQALGNGACVQCHSNHGVRHPNDEMLGVGKQSVCVECHFEGTSSFKAAAAMSGRIGELAAHIREAGQILQEAANDGMEVSRPQFDLREAGNKLIDARVVIHSFAPGQVDTVVKPGLEVAQKAHQAGLLALSDFQFRRKGLAVSLLFIAIAVAAIFLKLRQIERRQASGN